MASPYIPWLGNCWFPKIRYDKGFCHHDNRNCYKNEEYENGGSSFGGDFIEQGKGWAGIKSGNEPQEGYFEFVNSRLKLAESPHLNETNRLLTEIVKYNDELRNAYKQANMDFEKDIDRLGQLLKENLYTWWD